MADKTGYPIDMLELDMQLDADLGIDSIKRVEIFSAVQDRLPEAPTVKPEHLGSLRTLRQVAEFLAQAPSAALAQSTIPATLTPERNGDLQHSPRGSLVSAMAETLLQVVADKTGYPVDMLELDMQLDADLGIDSIKRVEIFSAVQDRLPEAPTVKPEHLGSLRTLRQIAEFLADEPVPNGQAEPRSADDGAARLPEPVELSSPAKPSTRLKRLAPTSVPLADPESRVPLRLPHGGEIWLTDDGSMLTEKLRSVLSASRPCRSSHPAGRVAAAGFRTRPLGPDHPGSDGACACIVRQGRVRPAPRRGPVTAAERLADGVDFLDRLTARRIVRAGWTGGHGRACLGCPGRPCQDGATGMARGGEQGHRSGR